MAKSQKFPVIPGKDPDIQARREELVALQEEVDRREMELAALLSAHQAFDKEYSKTVGSRYIQLEELETEIARHKGGFCMESCFQQGPTSGAAAAEGADNEDLTDGTFPNDSSASGEDRLKMLYRSVVKRVHPDHAISKTDRARRHDLLIEANAAYADKDFRRLEILLRDTAEFAVSAGRAQASDELRALIDGIAGLRSRLRKINSEIASLRADNLHGLMLRTQAARTQGRNLLAEIADDLEREITEKRQVLVAINREKGTRGRRQ